MVEKWIHRECERDVDDLVQPTQHSVRGRCAVCGQTFGAVWLNEVEEAVSEPSEPIEPEPELEVIAVLEEAENKMERIGIKLVDEDGNGVELKEVFEKSVELTKEKVQAGLEERAKEAEIARLRAEIEALEK